MLFRSQSFGLQKEDRVKLKSPYGECEYRVMPTDKLRDDCVLLYSGAQNANMLTPPMISQEGECAIYQELKVQWEKVQ